MRQRIWQPDDQLFLIAVAEGFESVRATVHNLRTNGYSNVFGLIDRDFRSSNRSKWANPDQETIVYVPERLEVENYLLDWHALAGCGENRGRNNRTRQEIKLRAETFAGNMLCWMACRKVISDIRERLVGCFPQHPKLSDMTSLADAETYIKSNRNWWRRLPIDAAYIGSPNNLRLDLTYAYYCYEDELNNGVWNKKFSGKEKFRHIRGYLFNQAYADQETMDTDLAKSVADWQIENQAVPAELIEIKESIKRHLGI